MRIQELGNEIRKARLARGLTQAQLAGAAGLSFSTLNQLENGVFPDLGVRKAQAILDLLGLNLTTEPAKRLTKPDFIRMACATASVSFKTDLEEDQLIRALLTAKVPSNIRPHIRTLLDEADPSLLEGLFKEVSRWTKPGKLERNLARIADVVGASRNIEQWLQTA